MDQASALRKIVANIKSQRSREPKGGARVICVTSGKGGVGKTSFTVNFAISLRKKGLRVLVIDADFGLANVDVLMGVPTEYDLSYVVNNSKDIRDIITEGPEGVLFVSGGSGVLDLVSISGPRFENLLSNMLKLDDLADVVIFDTGAGISNNIIRMLLASEEVVVITTPEPTSIMDAYALIKVLSGMERSVKLHLVVNRAESVAEGMDTLSKFASVVRTYLGVDIGQLGFIHNDAVVSKAVRLQRPFMQSFPRSTAARNIDSIVWKFLNIEPEKTRWDGVRGFVGKFFGKSKAQEDKAGL